MKSSAVTCHDGLPRRSSPAEDRCEPTQTQATILYSDIEGFTSIVERMPPGRVVDMLNEYFPR